MRIIDQSAHARGIFTLNVFHRGELIDQFSDDNLIVNRGRANVVRLLGGASYDHRITKIGFGTNGSAAAPENTALQGAHIKTVDAVSYPDAYSVLFGFSLGASEANGLQIQEFGLITQSGLLHARKVRGGILVKDSDLALSGTWKLMY